MLVCVFQIPHPLGVKVLFDIEAVDDTGGGQTAFYTGHEDQQQGQLRGSHSEMNMHTSYIRARTCKYTCINT